MIEHPILFNAAMVRAILDGRKTQTRRPIRPQPDIPFDVAGIRDSFVDGSGRAFRSPYGARNDLLWVRETWQHSNHPCGPYDPDCAVSYRADYLDDPHGPDGEKSAEGRYRHWRPSIHMPRTASRITLVITDVHVEHVQDISETDAIAEGIESEDYLERQEYFDCVAPPGSIGGPRPIPEYRELWDRINAARGHGWDANPLVWVVEFKREGGTHQ